MIKINIEGLKKYDGQPMDISITFNLSPVAKETIKGKAKSFNMKISQFMRAATITDEVFVVLNPTSSIAQEIVEAHSSITCIIREKRRQEKAYSQLISRLNKAYSDMEALRNELPEYSVKSTYDTSDICNVASSELKSANIQFYVSKHLKEYIDEKAARLGMDVAQLLRISALTEHPVYILEKGDYISRYLIELYDKINEAILNDKLDSKFAKIIHRKVEDIYELFVEISLHLTNVNLIEGASDMEE